MQKSKGVRLWLKKKEIIKNGVKQLWQDLPWLFLLLALNGFFILLLWVADVQAFRVLIPVMGMATILLFLVVSVWLMGREYRKQKAWETFLNNPDEWTEQALLDLLGGAQKRQIRLLSKVLHQYQEENERAVTQLEEYQDYVENWAHETKTPLSLLTFLLDNRREELPSSLVSRLDHVRCRMQESVDQMLYYARLRGARKDYLFEWLDLRCCLEEVLADYQPLLEEKQFEIIIRIQKEKENEKKDEKKTADETAVREKVPVYTDRRGISFLLGQFISNSIKYSGEYPTLTACIWLKPDETLLQLCDNGIGVKSCDLPYIFEKGFTGDSGDSRKKATGMGLYLAREMAEDLALTLDVESVWKKGFTARIHFPIVCDIPSAPPETERSGCIHS